MSPEMNRLIAAASSEAAGAPSVAKLLDTIAQQMRDKASDHMEVAKLADGISQNKGALVEAAMNDPIDAPPEPEPVPEPEASHDLEPAHVDPEAPPPPAPNTEAPPPAP